MWVLLVILRKTQKCDFFKSNRLLQCIDLFVHLGTHVVCVCNSNNTCLLLFYSFIYSCVFIIVTTNQPNYILAQQTINVRMY